MIRLLLL